MNIYILKKTVLIIAIIVFTMMAIVSESKKALAQDVKYCKNYKTGAIVVVSAGMPCPFPTVEL